VTLSALPSGEDQLLAWLRRRLGSRSLLGHDAAVLPADLAVTVDTQIEGVHFPRGLDPALVARRLLAVNLSDLAATGAIPSHAFLALAGPPGLDRRRFLGALVDAARDFGLELAGGDLARDRHLWACLTLIGRRRRAGRWLRRDGARPGHELWVGGTLGEAAGGQLLVRRGARLEGNAVRLPPLAAAPAVAAAARRAARQAVRRHLLPTPQLELGSWLARQRAGAAIDVSDGLARDLHRLCRESGVGAEVDADALPMAPGFAALARLLRRDPLGLALAGGEDYVLLFTLPGRIDPPPALGCARIGRLTAGRAVRLRRGGALRPLPPLGWDHLRPTSGAR
jgi:thiamine-monophosphate kinase